MEDIYATERLKWTLIRENKGKELDEVIKGEECVNDIGMFYRIVKTYEIDLRLPHREVTIDSICSDLILLPGVGPATADSLRKKGITSLKDVIEDSRWCEPARDILQMIEDDDIASILSVVERWHKFSHPSCNALLGMAEKEDLLFFDIETMGLRHRPLFLIGVGYFDGDNFVLEQFLARDTSEEKAVIHEFLNQSATYDIMVSFNGRSFDARFIRERMERYDMNGFKSMPHFDLLHMSRGRWELINNKLSTIEGEVLGVERDVDISSALVPHFYELFLRRKNPGPLIPIIGHNQQDIVSMVHLLDILCKGLKDQ